MSEVSVWAERLSLPREDDELKKRLGVSALPVGLLDLNDLDASAEILKAALERIHVATAQELATLRRVFAVGRAHALKHHADERTHIRSLYDLRASVEREPYTCMITSLGGIGKSALADAIKRLLGRPSSIEIAGHGTAPVAGGIVIEIGSGTRLVDVLNAVRSALDENCEGIFTNSNAESQKRARSLLVRAGCCFIIVDEFQFLTHSTEASAQLAKTLAFLRGLGVPLFFIGNYSLGHRLLRRPQEERQRLLLSPIVLQPDLPTDPEYRQLLGEYKVACAGMLNIDVDRDAEDIHWFTGGTKRLLRQLIVEAFRIAGERARREKSPVSISVRELRVAYKSQAFDVNRADLERCRQVLIGGISIRNRTKHLDLVCPFELEPQQQEVQEALVHCAMAATRAAESIVDVMTSDEIAGAQRARDQFGMDTDLPLPRAKKTSTPRPKKTLESLRRAQATVAPPTGLLGHP